MRSWNCYSTENQNSINLDHPKAHLTAPGALEVGHDGGFIVHHGGAQNLKETLKQRGSLAPDLHSQSQHSNSARANNQNLSYVNTLTITRQDANLRCETTEMYEVHAIF